MKKRMPILFGAGLVCLSALSSVQAQSNNFSVVTDLPGSGGGSRASLILSGNTLYGTTSGVPSGEYGTLFSVNTDGSGYTNLAHFPYRGGATYGSSPEAGVVLSSETLFGTTSGGGMWGGGTVFAVNTNGSGFTDLLALGNGANPNMGTVPNGGLLLSGSMLYGTLYEGGSYRGQVFGVSTNGSGFTNLHRFSAVVSSTNSDGAEPFATLIISGNTLYGTTMEGGAGGYGTVFSVNTDGSGFTNLHNFMGADGYLATCALVLAGNTLYGTTSYGGSANAGTVFAVNTDGSGFTNLYNFTALVSNTNSDGAIPVAGLVLSGTTLCGTAGSGGAFGQGTVFVVNTDGSGFANLHNFTDGADGGWPQGALILSGSTLYGIAYSGGNGDGTVFALTLPTPALVIAATGNQVVISWPVSPTNYVLQSTGGLFSGSWSNITDGIATSGNNCVLTNVMSSQAAFFRLLQQEGGVSK
jgi:uncharacterized repeat protein (TIGR03803 family)